MGDDLCRPCFSSCRLALQEVRLKQCGEAESGAWKPTRSPPPHHAGTVEDRLAEAKGSHMPLQYKQLVQPRQAEIIPRREPTAALQLTPKGNKFKLHQGNKYPNSCSVLIGERVSMGWKQTKEFMILLSQMYRITWKNPSDWGERQTHLWRHRKG